MYRLKTQPDEEHDFLSVGYNGLLAGVKAQEVANETGLVVVLERYSHLGATETPSGSRHEWRWVPDKVFTPTRQEAS